MIYRPLIYYAASSRKDPFLQEVPSDIGKFISGAANSQTIPKTYDEFMGLPRSQQDELKETGGYILGTLKGGRRKSSSVLTRSAGVLDADNVSLGQLEAVLRAAASLGWCYVVYSTAKHSTYSPRRRIILFFSTDIEVYKYNLVCWLSCQRIQPEMTWFDPTCVEAGRIMYRPSHCQDIDPVFAWGGREWTPRCGSFTFGAPRLA